MLQVYIKSFSKSVSEKTDVESVAFYDFSHKL